MSSKLVLTWVFSACSLGCIAQTNRLGSAGIDFCLPQIQLRSEPIKSGPVIARATSAPVANQAAIEIGLGEAGGAAFERSQVIRPGQIYISGPGPAVFLDKIFSPEKIQIGRSSLACPFWTAIKRKNPLAILSGFSSGSGDGLLEFRLLDLSW